MTKKSTKDNPAWSLYFGTPPELVSHTTLLYVTGLAAAVIFGIFGLYALSAAGDLRPLPLLRMGLLVIGGVYTLRGLLVIPQLLYVAGVLQSAETIFARAVLSSLVSLVVGVLYLSATIVGWRSLPAKTKDQALP